MGCPCLSLTRSLRHSHPSSLLYVVRFGIFTVNASSTTIHNLAHTVEFVNYMGLANMREPVFDRRPRDFVRDKMFHGYADSDI